MSIILILLTLCGTAPTTHTTLQVSQSLFDLLVAEISARNEIPIESLLKIRSVRLLDLLTPSLGRLCQD